MSMQGPKSSQRHWFPVIYVQSYLMVPLFSFMNDIIYNNQTKLIQFMEGGSRRLQGDGTIKRSQEYEHINTTYLQYDKTIQSVSYYNRRKKQLKVAPSNEVIINLTNRNAQRDDLKSHIENIFQSNKSINPYIQNYIKQVRMEPVINDNKFTNFNEQLYPLNEEQKVKVMQERYFPLQNYYNYILDLQLNKEIFSVINEPEPKNNYSRKSDIISRLNQQNLKDSLQYPIEDIKLQKAVTKDKRIKGFYQSRFSPHNSQMMSKHPHKKQNPSHFKQSLPLNSQSMRLTVSENQRMKLSKMH